MIHYLLDTNTCIHLIKHHPESLRIKLASLSTEQIAISSIVCAELWYGVAFSLQRKQNEAALEDFLRYIAVLDWPKEAAPIYGKIRAELRRKGTPIGAMDLLIAAHAQYLEAVLVTDNHQEFARVPGLKIENWVPR